MNVTYSLDRKYPMEYRRFGKTEKMLSAITLGTMRFVHCWEDPRDRIPKDSINHIRKIVELAFASGINHIETAHGYKKSEYAHGIVLNDELKVPRDSYFLMTKGDALTASDMRRMVEEQLIGLKTDYFDFYGWHGMNNRELFEKSCSKGGPVEELHKLKEEGIIKHIGFSTHAPLDVIKEAINTDLFEFVNLHYYYINQRNWEAIQLAEKKDMGVFIISPNDKGGQLFKAPQKLRKLIPHTTPIQWNARFCLSSPAIHTLSFGMSDPTHFEEMQGIFPSQIPISEKDLEAKLKLDEALNAVSYSSFDGHSMQGDPSGINIPDLLRFRKLWKGLDMKSFGQYRYKEMEQNSHWMPGIIPEKEALDKIDYSKVPEGIPLREMLEEIHKVMYVPTKK